MPKASQVELLNKPQHLSLLVYLLPATPPSADGGQWLRSASRMATDSGSHLFSGLGSTELPFSHLNIHLIRPEVYIQEGRVVTQIESSGAGC